MRPIFIATRVSWHCATYAPASTACCPVRKVVIGPRTKRSPRSRDVRSGRWSDSCEGAGRRPGPADDRDAWAAPDRRWSSHQRLPTFVAEDRRAAPWPPRDTEARTGERIRVGAGHGAMPWSADAAAGIVGPGEPSSGARPASRVPTAVHPASGTHGIAKTGRPWWYLSAIRVDVPTGEAKVHRREFRGGRPLVPAGRARNGTHGQPRSRDRAGSVPLPTRCSGPVRAVEPDGRVTAAGQARARWIAWPATCAARSPHS
jgi:hypothetical protein